MTIVEFVTPVRGDRVVIRTASAWDDQAIEISVALADVADHVKISLLVSRRDTLPRRLRAIPNVRAVSAASPYGLWLYVRSAVVIYTHGVRFANSVSARKKLFINVWHGMPVKILEGGLGALGGTLDWGVATAPVHATNLASAWSVPVEKIAITGLPRNDVLKRAKDPWITAAAGGISPLPIIVWLPTYRQFQTGVHSSRTDGVDQGNVFQLPDATIERVNLLLNSLNVFGVIKTHPMAPHSSTVKLDNLLVLNDSDLVDLGITLYELLSCSAALITDYSSVWIDYLLTDKPIIFSAPDLARYSMGRGFYFEITPDFLPGPIANDLDSLAQAVRTILNDAYDPWSELRLASRAFHHTHVDALSSWRVADLASQTLAS